MAPTSEQELKILLDEGKITQEEYEELLAAMKDKPRPNGNGLTVDNKNQSNAKMGKTALILCVISIVLPELILLFSWFMAGLKDGSGSNVGAIFVILLLLTEFVCVILAIVLGIVAWKTTMGKIAVFGALFLSGAEILLLFTVMAYKASEVHSGAKISVVQTYKTYSCDTLDSLIVGQSGSPVEKGVFSEEEDRGAIKIQVLGADTFHLYETGPLENASNTMLFYQAKVRTESLTGKAYLELWCSIPGKGEFFSRGLDQPISGTNNWMTMKIPFRNDSGINPDNIKMNLVVEGTGTIWIDDIQVTGQSL
jgi:hypothetical protein